MKQLVPGIIDHIAEYMVDEMMISTKVNIRAARHEPYVGSGEASKRVRE